MISGRVRILALIQVYIWVYSRCIFRLITGFWGISGVSGSAPFGMSRRRVKQNSTNIEHEMESSIETSFESPPNSSSSMTFSSSFVSSNPTPYSNSSPPKNCPGTTKALSVLILSTLATPRTLVRRLSQRNKENCSPSPGR